MSTCDNCNHAEWRKTANGRLHPDKSGRCTFLDKKPLDLRIPAAFYWLDDLPRPCSGFIKRGEEHKPDCVFKDGSRP